MGCSRFAETLKAHAAGGDLAPDARAHLAECEACRLDLARRRRLIAGIDADLARALDVAPSAEFLPRLRTRIAAGGAVVRWWTPGWRWAAGAASLAIAAGAVAISLWPAPPAPPSETREARASSPVAAAPSAALSEKVTTPGAGPGAARVTTLQHRAVATRVEAEPEVLISQDQRIAFDQLLRMARAGRLDEKMFPAASAAAPVAVPPIVVEDLAVAPITIRGAVERQR